MSNNINLLINKLDNEEFPIFFPEHFFVKEKPKQYNNLTKPKINNNFSRQPKNNKILNNMFFFKKN